MDWNINKISALKDGKTQEWWVGISNSKNFDHEWQARRMKDVEQFPEINSLAT